MTASQAHAICVHATTPPSGGGPGSRIDRVVRRIAILAMGFDWADLVLDRGSSWDCVGGGT